MIQNARSLVVCPDAINIIECAVPGCHRSFQATQPVPPNDPYVCLNHSPFTASKCWAIDLNN